ncbi:MAG: YihY family inner membrane protein [Agarilytica sp.]
MTKQSLIQFGENIIAFFRNLAFEFIDKSCQKSAAALTYMTLFALVPMMMVTYSMFSLIPAFSGLGDQLHTMIFSNFLPETGSEVQQYLSNFSKQARSLTLPGVAMLVVTAFLMLRNIEKTFNNIWGVKKARRGLTSFLLYWAVLSIGPLFLGAGLMMSTYLISMKLVVGQVDIITVAAPIFRILPLFMGSVAFTLLFVAVPNCRVPLRDAVVGGVVTAVCFEAAKAGFGAFVANSSFQLIYGAFAVVPLFLLWVNFIWVIVLSGAVLTRTLAEKAYVTKAGKQSDLVAILSCLAVFREKTLSGDTVSDKDCVSIGVSLVHWQRLRSLMVDHKWIAVTENGNYVLTRDLNQQSLWSLAEILDLSMATEPFVYQGKSEPPHWLAHLNEIVAHIRQNSCHAMSQSLENLYIGENVSGFCDNNKENQSIST